MKKITTPLLLLASIVILFFTSCSDDETTGKLYLSFEGGMSGETVYVRVSSLVDKSIYIYAKKHEPSTDVELDLLPEFYLISIENDKNHVLDDSEVAQITVGRKIKFKYNFDSGKITEDGN
jgi:hypothetical protein